MPRSKAACWLAASRKSRAVWDKVNTSCYLERQVAPNNRPPYPNQNSLKVTHDYGLLDFQVVGRAGNSHCLQTASPKAEDRARYFRIIKVSTIIASIPLSSNCTDLKSPLNSQIGRPCEIKGPCFRFLLSLGQSWEAQAVLETRRKHTGQS